LSTASRPALGPNQPLIQLVLGIFYSWVNRPEREADHSPPFSAKVKNTWSYTSTPPCVLLSRCLIKHREKFAFSFTIGTEKGESACLQYAKVALMSFKIPQLEGRHIDLYVMVQTLPLTSACAFHRGFKLSVGGR
jgi:hypothetical protein